MSTMTISTKWWWNKKTKKTPKSIASSINGADEGASMFSLYSYDYCPSTYQVSSSIKAQHTKSEYSGNYSDVESNASILSKPWISRNMIDFKDDISISSNAYSIPIMKSSSADNISIPKRRASFVDYIVNKPLHGKLKASFEKLVGRSHSNIEEPTTSSTCLRRSSIS